jgi:hypothetical protein
MPPRAPKDIVAVGVDGVEVNATLQQVSAHFCVAFEGCTVKRRRSMFVALVNVSTGGEQLLDTREVVGSRRTMKREGKRVLQRPTLSLGWILRREPG